MRSISKNVGRLIGGLLALEAGPSSARGRAVLWALVVVLVSLSVLEIANL